jgi:hypothetical protein
VRVSAVVVINGWRNKSGARKEVNGLAPLPCIARKLLGRSGSVCRG